MKNYYHILGLSEGATDEEIKRAYRKLALRHHPDTNEKDTSDKFIEIKEAYQVLINQESNAAASYSSQKEKVFSRRHNRWMTREELSQLKKQTTEYRKKKEEQEEMEALRDFENLKKSWVYKAFPVVAIFGLLFSILLFLDFHLNPQHNSVEYLETKRISLVEGMLVGTAQPGYILSEIITKDKNGKEHTAFVQGELAGYFYTSDHIEVVSTFIFDIDLGYQIEDLYFRDINQKRAFHYPIGLFCIILVVLTVAFKNPTPFYYAVLNTAVIGIPLLALLFVTGSILD